MDLALAALALLGIVVSYLAALRVPWPMTGRILRVALRVALLLSLTLGLLYFLYAPERPADIIAACFMTSLLLAAAYLARGWILGTITPAGIVLLNVAANLAPQTGPVPMTFLWLANLIPIPYGTLRIALNVVVLYWPALAALWMLHRGPPGNPVLRLSIGIWVCWIGIGAVAGPGWDVAKGLHDDASAIDWLSAGIAIYAVMHALMLALSLVLAVVAGQFDKGELTLAIARSVRIDGVKPWLAAGCGIAFWGASYVLVPRVETVDSEIVAGVLIAAAFGLGSVLAFLFPVRATDDKELERSAMGMAALVTALAMAGGFVAIIMAVQGDPRPRADKLLLSPATGTTGHVETVYPMFIRYPDDHRQRVFQARLEKARVPYATTQKEGREVIVVGGEHQEAVLKILDDIKAGASTSR